MMNPFKRHRVDYVFFVSFALVISVLLGMALWIGYAYSTSQMAANTSYYQKDLLQELNKQITLQMQSVEQISLAASREIGSMSALSGSEGEYERLLATQAVEQMLANITHSSSHVQMIQLFAEGLPPTEELGAVRFGSMSRMDDYPWLAGIRDSDFLWIGNHRIPTYQGPTPVVSFARNLYGLAGELRGVLVLHVKSSAFSGILEGEEGGKTRILLDSGGRTILMSKAYEAMGMEPDGLFDGSWDSTEPSGYRRMKDERGEEVLLVWSQSYASRLMLGEITPWSEITKGSVKMAKAISMAGGLAVLLALALTLFLSRQFVKPVMQLLTAMNRFTGERWTTRLPEDYRNEFGQLFQGYRRLTERIRELLATLEEEYKRKRAAEISALQAMINPHFLYNSLDQLNWLALDEGNEKISRILEKMGRMFRIGLSKGESLIKIRDELELLRSYSDIQEILWEHKLSVRFDVEERLLDWYIPKMTLQPFVENAIKHGFHGRDGGLVTVTGRMDDGGRLIFTVADDGIGFDPEQRETDSGPYGGGYGLRNVKERIEAYYGPEYGFVITSEPGKGTRVDIRIPIMAEKP